MPDVSRRTFAASCLAPVAVGAGCFLPSVFAGCGGDSREAKTQGGTDDTSINGQALTMDFRPSYLALHESGELQKRGDELWRIMENCRLCPRECGVDRLGGEVGFCRATSELFVSSCNPHFGEEAPLVGQGGSGTIFMTHCGLRCVFCINWEVSHEGRGKERSIRDLALMMLGLQKIGCHNINIVTPTHYSPHVVKALDFAAENGLRLPLVYNTCGWERTGILRMLNGIVDIYLPDFKYADSDMAVRYSADAATYPEVTKTALLEMHHQVGVAIPGEDGIMRRGLMIRHLVMPNNVGGSKDVMRWIAGNLPKNTYVNIMSQYRPVYRASEFPDIDRRIRRREYAEVVDCARDLGLTNLDIQGYPLL